MQITMWLLTLGIVQTDVFRKLNKSSLETNLTSMLIILFIPRTLIAFGGLFYALGWNLKSWTIILQQPHLILMAYFTPYVHSSYINIKQPNDKLETHLVISPMFTVLNSIIRILMHLYREHYIIAEYFDRRHFPTDNDPGFWDDNGLWVSWLVFLLPCLVYLMPVLTFTCFNIKYQAIVVSDPKTAYFIKSKKLFVETKL